MTRFVQQPGYEGAEFIEVNGRAVRISIDEWQPGASLHGLDFGY